MVKGFIRSVVSKQKQPLRSIQTITPERFVIYETVHLPNKLVISRKNIRNNRLLNRLSFFKERPLVTMTHGNLNSIFAVSATCSSWAAFLKDLLQKHFIEFVLCVISLDRAFVLIYPVISFSPVNFPPRLNRYRCSDS